MRIYEFLMTIIAVAVIILGFTFGLDREMARRDYEKAVYNKDYERPIVGCLYESNCVHYTKMLGEK